METCRLCFDDGVPGETLCSPCNCRGSSEHIHKACLLQWINVSGRTSCEICKTDFPLRMDVKERECLPSSCAHRLIVNPFFHIGIQYLSCVSARTMLTYSLIVNLFLIQHFVTMLLYAAYVLSNVKKLWRYMNHYVTIPALPYTLLFHTTLIITLFMSRNLPYISSPPALILFMTGCNMLICVYPLHHIGTIESINSVRTARLVV